MRALLTAVLITAFQATITAAPSTPVETFPAALAEAKSSGKPIAVFIHGSNWHPASKRYRKTLWNPQKLNPHLKNEIILTHINVPQLLDKEESKAFNESVKPWNRKTVSSYPALQLYAADGHLLKTYQGKEILILNSPETIGNHINHIARHAATRTQLLEKIKSARSQQDKAQETKLLSKLTSLPINREPKILDQFKAADPSDSSGWQARLSFNDWDYIRHISNLISKKEISKARADIEQKLESPHYTDRQRTFILGAMARLLVAEQKLDQAWEFTLKAAASNPDSPEAIAILEYGKRETGHPKPSQPIP